MAQRDDAPLADEPQPGAAPNDMPSGLPDEGAETPIGPGEADPDGEGDPSRGTGAMPGIPEEGEADTAG